MEIGPGSVIRALVVGPDSLAHGNEEGGLPVVLAALAAIAELDDERAALYYDVLIASLSEGLRQELQAMVLKGKYEYQSDFAREYVKKGREQGLAEGIEEGIEKGRHLGCKRPSFTCSKRAMF